jgi:hypothetical protein
LRVGAIARRFGELRPPFRHEERGFARIEVEQIPHVGAGEIDAIDLIRELSSEANAWVATDAARLMGQGSTVS